MRLKKRMRKAGCLPANFLKAFSAFDTTPVQARVVSCFCVAESHNRRKSRNGFFRSSLRGTQKYMRTAGNGCREFSLPTLTHRRDGLLHAAQ